MRSPLPLSGRQHLLLAFLLSALATAHADEKPVAENERQLGKTKRQEQATVQSSGSVESPEQAPGQKPGAARANYAQTTVQDIISQKAADDKRFADFLKARETKEVKAATDHDQLDWHQAATRQKLSKSVMTDLERDKLAYGDSIKQVFTPYLGGPAFVTSDALLACYHLVLERSLLSYEEEQAQHLKARIAWLMDQSTALAKEDLELSETQAREAIQHLHRVIGPVYLLQGGNIEKIDTAVREEAREEAKRIQEAQGLRRPSWLLASSAQDDLQLDYGRFKPIGFYTSSETLRIYFQTVRWLQQIPFRPKFEHEFNALALVAVSTKGVRGISYRTDLRLCSSILGPGDEPSPDDLEEILEPGWPHRPKSGFFKWDDERTRRRVCQMLILRHLYRVNADEAARKRLPMAWEELDFRLVPEVALPEARLFQAFSDARIRPSGLQVAAWLGSTLARAKLGPEEIRIMEQQMQLETAPREPHEHDDAPFIKSYLLTLKSLTAEAEPEAAPFLRGKAWERKTCQTVLASWIQLRHSFTLQAKENKLYLGATLTPPGFVEPNPTFYARLYETCQLTEIALRGGYEHESQTGPLKDRDRWQKLEELCLHLQALAEKQLRGADWNAVDAHFLKQIGEQMAWIMGYEGNSYLTPRDDAPRWAAYAFDATQHTVLGAGVGRPRLIYVLYPWKGKEVLCKGAVLQYYEQAETERLTDEEWKTKLDSASAPAIPCWLEAEPPTFKADRQH